MVDVVGETRHLFQAPSLLFVLFVTESTGHIFFYVILTLSAFYIHPQRFELGNNFSAMLSSTAEVSYYME